MRTHWLNPFRWPLSAQFLLLAGIDTHLALYLSRGENAEQTLLALLLAVLLFLLAVSHFDQEQQEARPLALRWDRYDVVALLLLALLAFALRGFTLEQAPLAVHNDEAIIGMRTLDLIGKPLAVFWQPDEWSLTKVWYYAQLPFLLLFGPTMTAVRMFSAVAGTLSILSAYLFIRLLFTQRLAMGMAFLLATYHLHIHFSRISVPNILDPLWGTLIFSGLTLGLTTRRYFWFAVSGVIMGVALNFYPGARLFIPLIALLGLGWTWAQRQPWRAWLWPESWFPWLLVALGFGISAAPYLQAAWHEPRFFLIRFTTQQVTAKIVEQAQQTQGWTPLRFWFEQFRHGFLSFYLAPLPGYQGFYDNNLPLMMGLSAWLLAAGSLLALWRWRRWPYPLLIVWYLLASLAGGMLMIEPAAPQRFVTLTVVVCLLVALTLEQLRHWALFRWPAQRWPLEVVVLLLYVYLAFNSVNRYYFYYLANPAHYAPRSSQLGTALAFYLRTQPSGSEIWFVGKHGNSLLHSHIPQYLAPHVLRNDLTRFQVTDAGAQPTVLAKAEKSAPPTIFITAYYQPQERIAITQRYPGGVEEPIYWPGIDLPVLTAYKFAPP